MVDIFRCYSGRQSFGKNVDGKGCLSRAWWKVIIQWIAQIGSIVEFVSGGSWAIEKMMKAAKPFFGLEFSQRD